MEICTRKYYKFRYGNRLYTREEARKLGKTILDADGKTLYVFNIDERPRVMHSQECAYGQRYVEEDTYLKKRDKDKELLS